MGKPLLGLILITRIRASHGSCNHPDGLSPRKQIIRLIRQIGYAELKVRGQKIRLIGSIRG